MTLNKRYLRNVKENLSFYIAAAVLTVVALLLFYLFYIAGTGIKSYGDQFFIDNKLEDATFTTYVEIPDNEIANIEKKYNVTFEKEHYVNINEDGYKVRVFKRNKKIDLYEVIDGNDISNDDEIVISKGYAESEHVNIGDRLTIKGKEYKVTGYFLRPDYLYMLENADDSYKNITSFFLAYMTDSAYDALEANSCQYKVVYSDDSDVRQFRKDMNEQYKIDSYLAKDNNQRITMVDDQAMMFFIMAFVFLFTLPLITVALIAIIIGRKIKQEQKMIGTLSALGYTKRQLMWHYSVLAMIPGLAGGIIVTIITKIIQQPYGEMSLADYEPMPVHFTLPISIAVIGIIIPTAIYMLEAAHKVSKLLKKDTVEMLNGNADGDSRTRHVLVGKKGKVRNKFALRSILANSGRSFVVFLGAFLGTVSTLLAVILTLIICFIGVTRAGIGTKASAMQDSRIDTVKEQQIFQDESITFGQCLDNKCTDPEWTIFSSTDNKKVVEFNGKVVYNNTNSSLKIQFTYDESISYWTINYMGLNGTAMDSNGAALLLNYLCSDYLN